MANGGLKDVLLTNWKMNKQARSLCYTTIAGLHIEYIPNFNERL